MRNLITALAIIGSTTAFANVRVEIARTFTGAYTLQKEITNDTKEPCAPEIRIKYWNSDKFLDVQFLNQFEGVFFVNQQPSTREYLENSYVFDIVNKVNVSEDEKYKTVTRITNSRIEEKTFKGKPGKYELRRSSNLSRNPFNGDVRYEFIDKKFKTKECLYR